MRNFYSCVSPLSAPSCSCGAGGRGTVTRDLWEMKQRCNGESWRDPQLVQTVGVRECQDFRLWTLGTGESRKVSEEHLLHSPARHDMVRAILKRGPPHGHSCQ